MADKKPSPRMTSDEIWSYVTDAHTGILTTLRRDGVPIALPLWFACIDGKIYSQTRGRKLQRIAHDGRASFLVESGEKWVDLKAVHLTGIAEIVDLDEGLTSRFHIEFERKYAAFRPARADIPAETATYYAKNLNGVVRFTADERVLNWDNAKLARSV